MPVAHPCSITRRPPVLTGLVPRTVCLCLLWTLAACDGSSSAPAPLSLPPATTAGSASAQTSSTSTDSLSSLQTGPQTGPQSGPQIPASIDSNPPEVLGDGTPEVLPPTTPIRQGVELHIAASASQLHFAWPSEDANAVNRLWQLDPDDPAPALVKEFTGQRRYDWSQSIDPLALDWAELSFEIDVCESVDCRTSTGQPIAGLLTQAAHALEAEPDESSFEVQVQDIALSRHGDVALLCNDRSVAVHVRQTDQWRRADPLPEPIDAKRRSTDAVTCKLAASALGDTVAHVVRHGGQGNVQIVERLGEGWVNTARFDLPAALDIGARLQVSMDSTGDRAVVIELNDVTSTSLPAGVQREANSEDQTIRMHWLTRDTGGWRLQETVLSPLVGHIIDLTTDSDLRQLGWLEIDDDDTLWLVQREVTSGRHRVMALPELAPRRDSRLAMSGDARQWLVAGWTRADANALALTRLHTTDALDDDTAAWRTEYRTTVHRSAADTRLHSLVSSDDLERVGLSWYNGEQRSMRLFDGFSLDSTVAWQDALVSGNRSFPLRLSGDGLVLLLADVQVEQGLQTLAFH